MNGKAQGQGRIYHVNGDIYVGEWKDDKPNGYGKYIFGNGAVYEG